MFPILNFDNNFFIESEKLESSEAKFINNNHSTFAPIEQKNLVSENYNFVKTK